MEPRSDKKRVKALAFNGNMSRPRYLFFIALFSGLLLFVIVLSLSIGQYKIPFGHTLKIIFSWLAPIKEPWDFIRTETGVIRTMRMPRTLAAMFVGAALAVSGASYQSLFKNPMVSPDILGVSSGACIGAATAILLSAGSVAIQIGAFAGGCIAVFLTVLIPKLIKNDSTLMLVLAGIIVGSMMSSVMSVIKFMADPDTKLAEITYWTMGSFAGVSMNSLYYVMPGLIVPMVILLCMRYRLNILSLSDFEAKSLGVNIGRTRLAVIICSTLLTACSVVLAGTVGWVGLVIPHLSRMIVGADNKKMLPVAMLMGATFMVIIDIMCRMLTPMELKLGILTGIIGAPFYLFILIKQRRTVR